MVGNVEEEKKALLTGNGNATGAPASGGVAASASTSALSASARSIESHDVFVLLKINQHLPAMLSQVYLGTADNLK